MDMSADQLAIQRGKRATVPKHGKKPENRLYSKWRRGNPQKEGDGDGSINPDASIEVAAVCGNEVRIYNKGKKVRRLSWSYDFSSHGKAREYAAEHDASERRCRSAKSSETSERVFAPFYQIKVGGVVIDQTNNRERAHAELRAGAARPKELWLVSESGAELLDSVSA